MKKLVFISLIGFMFLVGFINQRTPFFLNDGDGWSIIYGETGFEKIDLENGVIYNIDSLKKYDKTTVFLADPFWIEEEDSTYIFIERAKKTPNAEIGVLVSGDLKNYRYKGTVLKEKFHLSYPQVFKHRNVFYMLPETKNSNNILLYVSDNFPFNWKVKDTLVKDVRLKDPSIYLSDTLNVMIASDDHLNLKIFISDSLSGKWKSPLKDIIHMGTEARPGGRFFSYNKKLYIPIQSCKKGYGSSLSLYEFKKSEEDEYYLDLVKSEFLTAHKEIPEFSHGMHHLDIHYLENNTLYFVADGDKIKENSSKKFNWKGPLKFLYTDIKNYFNEL